MSHATKRRALTLNVITERTDREWPADHPLRKITSVIADDGIARANVLVCTLPGEERLPAPAGDHDVEAHCVECGETVIHRASAPAGPMRMCWKCWAHIDQGESL
jgi:hypothetical protein